MYKIEIFLYICIMKTFMIIWGVAIIYCVLEAYFCSTVIEDEYSGDK